MAIAILIPNSSATALAARDTALYGQRLIERGGTDIFASGAADAFRAFAEVLYSRAGRTDFWAFRSGQAMGTGSIVYSFHDLRGVIIGGGTWGASGITFDSAAGQYISLPTTIGSVAINYSGLACGKQTSNPRFSRIFDIQGGAANNRNPLYGYRPNGSNQVVMSALRDSGFLSNSNVPADSSYHTIGYAQTTGLMYLLRDGTNLASAALIVGAVGSIITARFWSEWDGVGAFNMLVRTQITRAQYIDIETAYRQTLGYGLF